MTNGLMQFIHNLPAVSATEVAGVYPYSINQAGSLTVFMIKDDTEDKLVLVGEGGSDFQGQPINGLDKPVRISALNSVNAQALRHHFPFTAPTRVLRQDRSFGVGDRLGIATPGHIRAFRNQDVYPVFAQQSIRELTLTKRSFEDVLNQVTFAVFREGYKKGYGADGDHLKKVEDIEVALKLGFSMITLDCSDYIDNQVGNMTDQEVDREIQLDEDLIKRYLHRTFQIEDVTFTYDEISLKRIVLIYGKAIDFTKTVFHQFFIDSQANADFELSIDETMTPTTPLEHYFVASELVHQQVEIATLAPRFCGEFQKGIDYIGDLNQFEQELKVHAAIARHFHYKLSIHSGSDKFSVFPLIGRITRGRYHVKTAGTNWLEAMRAVALIDPALYREIHDYALSVFQDARQYYHVTTDLTRIPDISTLKDSELPALFNLNEARQLIHITYGLILNAQNTDGSDRFRTKLYQLWNEFQDTYAKMLEKHIGKHLALLKA
ncbi:MAG: tagaturonate epimerase family protein [Candidatus Izemoplasmatales bacterium]|nr:tagaturonate epimerase family protein [Candidatus Izemoplasmatales bacterium]MDD5601784.1 tagaturonate epimerase family protein [Candidatus Izemoplasmatales bacterium]